MPFEQHLKELKLTTFLSDYDKAARELGLMKKTSQDLVSKTDPFPPDPR